MFSPSYTYDPQLHELDSKYWFTNPINSKILIAKKKSDTEFDNQQIWF